MKKKYSRILGVGLTIVMLVSTLAFAVPALATISAPAVTVTPSTISASAQYVIKFDTAFTLTAGTDTITVVFPSGTTLPTAAVDSSIAVSIDNGTTYVDAGTVASGNITFTAASRTFVVKVPTSTVGATHMAVKFLTTAGIFNPGTAGSYILNVKTSQETTAVDSTAYTITSPVSVSRYNSLGNFVASYTTIQAAVDAAVDNDTLKLSEGTFAEQVLIPVGKDGLTIVATGTAANTIFGGTSGADNITIEGTMTTIDMLTIKGMVTVAATANSTTIKNSTLTKRSSAAGVTLLTSSAPGLVLTSDTIDTTSGTVVDVGVKLAAAAATAKITSVTFKLDSDTGLVSDTAIQTTAALTTATNSLVVDKSTFTGPYGIGYSDAVGSVGVVIKNSTFDQLEKAIDIANAASVAKIEGNTITNSVLSGTGTAALGAISLAANGGVTVVGNTVTGNKGFSLKVTDSDNVTVAGNSFSSNTMGLRNTDSVNSLNAKLNWWGAATGPTHATANPSGTGDKISDFVTFKPFLTGGASSAKVATTTAATASSLDASTTAGVAIEGVTTAAAAQIVLSKLASNPQAIEPAYTPLAGAYYDVFVSAASSTTISAKFYASNITSSTQVYFWSGLQGKWMPASEQGVSGAGDFVWANIKAVGATAPTVPTTSDLTGTPFVLVAGAPVTPAAFALTVPAAGATTPVTNVPFTWAGVTGATSYNLVISAKADLSSPITATAPGTAYTYTGTLAYSTPYYWQVTAMNGSTVVGQSNIATFVTAASPAAAAVAAVAINIVLPAIGAADVSIEPVFTWTAYAGAVGYEIIVASDQTFAIIDYSHNVATTFYKSETLAYGTTYYWKVRATTGPATPKGTPGSAFAQGVFTTMAKPVPPAKAEPTVIIQKEAAPPAQIVQVPVSTPQPIPSYLLWIIILVGAVLIIALIVLIARTRRVT